MWSCVSVEVGPPVTGPRTTSVFCGYPSPGARPKTTEFSGEDQSYAVALSTVTGAERKLTKNAETGLQGAALSPDGTTVLGTVGLGFGGNPKPKVVTVPWGGGPEKVLVAGGYEPSWGG